MHALREVAVEISRCRRCDSQGIAVEHSDPMERGAGTHGIVIGIQPGRTEIERAEAFTGPAGRRLIEWLVSAEVGKDRNEIFERIYFTSLAKCFCAPSDLRSAAINCRPFLIRQVDIVKPRFALTLGLEPLKHLFGIDSLEKWVGRLFYEREVSPSLFPLFPENCSIIPLPHPSPLSRWLNDDQNRRKLVLALARIRQIAGGAEHA